MKKKIFIALLLILSVAKVEALTYGGCEYKTISRMRSLISNINISYDYKIVNNKAYFDVTITNLFPDVYFVDSYDRKKYTYSDANNGEMVIKNYPINSGSYKFYSNLSDCYGVSLATKYYKFPSYNIYYDSDTCKEIPNFSLCQKWVSVNYSSSEFAKLVEDYKDGLKEDIKEEEKKIQYEKTSLDELVNFYINNYYYFLTAIIVVCLAIMIITRRKNRFKL